MAFEPTCFPDIHLYNFKTCIYGYNPESFLTYTCFQTEASSQALARSDPQITKLKSVLPENRTVLLQAPLCWLIDYMLEISAMIS